MGNAPHLGVDPDGGFFFESSFLNYGFSTALGAGLGALYGEIFHNDPGKYALYGAGIGLGGYAAAQGLSAVPWGNVGQGLGSIFQGSVDVDVFKLPGAGRLPVGQIIVQDVLSMRVVPETVSYGSSNPVNNAPDSWIPVIGPAERAYYWAQQGDFSRTMLYGAEAVSDVAMLKAAIQGGAKFAIRKLSSNIAKEGKTLFNFTKTAAAHMDEAGRMIPIQTLDDIIKAPMHVLKDPQGTKALMHYSQMWKNGKLYNVEVLYNKASNTIMHFKYTQKGIGPLKAILK